MSKANFLILSEQSKVFKLYESLFKENFAEINSVLIDDYELFNNLNLEQVDIVLIDLMSKKYISSLNLLIEKNIKSCKFILITPFELFSFAYLLKNVQFFDLILTKPVDIKKLELFIKNETYKIERKNILEKKNGVLGKVVDLNPSKITVYTLDGILFYANSSYLEFNNLKLNDIDNLTFDELNDNKILFETIKDKLLTNHILISDICSHSNSFFA